MKNAPTSAPAPKKATERLNEAASPEKTFRIKTGRKVERGPQNAVDTATSKRMPNNVEFPKMIRNPFANGSRAWVESDGGRPAKGEVIQ